MLTIYATVNGAKSSDFYLEPRQRSEQYFTSDQTLAHFFRHVNGRPHTTHVFVGRFAFLVRLVGVPMLNAFWTFPVVWDLAQRKPAKLCKSAAPHTCVWQRTSGAGSFLECFGTGNARPRQLPSDRLHGPGCVSQIKYLYI